MDTKQTVCMNTKQTVCDKLQQMFLNCNKPIYKFPVGPDAMLVNEAHKYNCIILSKELIDRCGNVVRGCNGATAKQCVVTYTESGAPGIVAYDSEPAFIDNNLPDEWNNSQNP
jgi:hypothetical protein